jgi:hypothetical protein
MLFALFLVISLSVSLPVTAVFGQGLPNLRPDISEAGTFQNTLDGIKFKVPAGWVVQDIDNLNLALNSPGFDLAEPFIYAIVCPQQEALPGIGGLYNCEQAQNSIQLMQHSMLEGRPQFAVIENPLDITPDDFLAFLIGDFQGRGYTNIKIVNSTDTTINVTSDENSTMVIRTLPAKFAEITYQPGIALPELRIYLILTTVPEERQPGTSQIITGISIAYEGLAATTPSAKLPTPEIQQIFDTFELMR